MLENPTMPARSLSILTDRPEVGPCRSSFSDEFIQPVGAVVTPRGAENQPRISRKTRMEKGDGNNEIIEIARK